MPDEFVNEVTERYIELYENITGEKFVRGDYSNALKRIEDNINKFLKSR
jgi:phosphoribosylaminoimidazole-succinocarboxamide synthase